MPAPDKNEEYIGDGVYAHVEFNTCIRLRTERYDRNPNEPNDFIYLEPDMLLEVIKIANGLGWVTTPRE